LDGIPELSVIVTVVEGGAALERCLNALVAQEQPPAIEIIIPYDDSIREVGALAPRYPGFKFVSLGTLGAAPRSAFEEHELYDRRRSAGLARALGPLIAMIEDRGWPRPDWARNMTELHHRFGEAAIGGAIECARTDPWLFAAYICDFGRYQPPLDDPSPEYVSDVNICYKRAPLERLRPLWETRYQEANFNWALRRSGESLRLSDRAVVVQERQSVSLRRLAEERFHWGRVFGQARGRDAAFPKRLLLAARAPLVPFVLFERHVSRYLRKGAAPAPLVRALPALFVLLCLWSLGELIGTCESGFARATPVRR
jgi:hypothetical protein